MRTSSRPSRRVSISDTSTVLTAVDKNAAAMELAQLQQQIGFNSTATQLSLQFGQIARQFLGG